MTIRVLVADDQALVRAGFVALLDAQDGIAVIAEADTGTAALAAARELRPDVVLMDIRMPDMDGLEATRRLLASDPALTRVLILTTFDLDEYVYQALHAGASGFLLKDSPPDQLVAAIRIIAGGDALLAPSITRTVIQEFARRPGRPFKPAAGIDDLTAREREVLTLLARGLSNSQIAQALVISDATVKTHVARVLMKLSLADRVHAVILAYETGIVQPGDA
jgi:DNA-binding NarL/FixJ family response regulator